MHRGDLAESVFFLNANAYSNTFMLLPLTYNHLDYIVH